MRDRGSAVWVGGVSRSKAGLMRLQMVVSWDRRSAFRELRATGCGIVRVCQWVGLAACNLHWDL